MTEKQRQVLKLYTEGYKAVEIQQKMNMKYIQSVYQILNSLKLKGEIKEEA